MFTLTPNTVHIWRKLTPTIDNSNYSNVMVLALFIFPLYFLSFCLKDMITPSSNLKVANFVFQEEVEFMKIIG